MQISYFFDPVCPWCWITSRWIEQVSAERELDITWRLFSLAYKNNELVDTSDSGKAKSHLAGHRVLRVLQHFQDAADGDTGELYRAFGKRHFIDGEAYDDTVIADILQSCGITDVDVPAIADNTDLNTAIIASTDEATQLVGDDIGVPTIVFHREDGQTRGFFGPVLTQLPDAKTSLKLWDGLATLAHVDGFSELKRGRDSGPDVASTARVFSD